MLKESNESFTEKQNGKIEEKWNTDSKFRKRYKNLKPILLAHGLKLNY